MRTASSANQRKNSAPYLTSPMLSGSTLPISSVISVAKSSARSVIVSNTERRISPRSRGGVAAQSACTAQAASSAAMASSAVALATVISTSSSDGSSTSNVEEPWRSSPPIHRPVGTDDSSFGGIHTLHHLLLWTAGRTRVGYMTADTSADSRHHHHCRMAGPAPASRRDRRTSTCASSSPRTPPAGRSWR